MQSQKFQIQRRNMMGVLSSLIAGVALPYGTSLADDPERKAVGRAGDFDFLTGEWKIKNRRLKAVGKDEWDEFEGEATCWGILEGVGSIEELRIPSRNFSGMGLRLLDMDKKIWNDFWVNSKTGVLACPGQQGVFEKGVGTFEADDMDDNAPIKVRGIWDNISKTGCRWRQAVSRDGGKTWQENWQMTWTRVHFV